MYKEKGVKAYSVEWPAAMLLLLSVIKINTSISAARLVIFVYGYVLPN